MPRHYKALFIAAAVICSSFVTIVSPAEAAPTPTFVYQTAEVHRWYNDDHPNNRIDRATAVQLRRYLNAITWNRVIRYLRAVAAAQQQSSLIWHWAGVADCESGGNPATNTGNGYYGAYQFSAPTWQSLGYSGVASSYSLATQTVAAERLRIRSGLGQWPNCGRYYR